VTRAFEITWDYRCPFARNAHEHVIEALENGADWDVTFVPFSLGQAHVAEGQPDVWDDPDADTGLLALQAGVVVRDKFPDRFLAVHRALFALRHDEGLQLKDEAELRRVLEAAGVDADAVFDEIASGRPLQIVKEEHTAAVEKDQVWGVPTFIQNGQSVFVRLMNRPEGDSALAASQVERVLDLLTWPELNEFKHTSIPR
jgi:protein-disulfide isomerase-like protein with CxxC motif